MPFSCSFLIATPAGVTGDGSPFTMGFPLFFTTGVSSSYSGASLLGAGVRLEVEIDAFDDLESLAKPLTGKLGSGPFFLWKKLAMEDWFLADCELVDFLREGGAAFASLAEPAIFAL